MFKKNNNILVGKIYQNIIEISRSKFFYLDYEVEDNFEARFDLITLHAFIIFYYYKYIGINKSLFSQSLFDLMFEDFENNLREMGFGDIAVNKKMKAFILAFYGRIAQYSKGLDLYFNNDDKELLEQTILNNIYKGKVVKKIYSKNFAEYMKNNIEHFSIASESVNIEKNFDFLKFY